MINGIECLSKVNIACVTAASPEKKSRRDVCVLPLIIVSEVMWLFQECVENDMIGSYIITRIACFWLVIIFAGFPRAVCSENHFEKFMLWVRACFAQFLLFRTATKISSTEGRVPHSTFELKYWRWTTEYRLTLPTFAGVATHYWRKGERFRLVLKKWTRSYITLYTDRQKIVLYPLLYQLVSHQLLNQILLRENFDRNSLRSELP